MIDYIAMTLADTDNINAYIMTGTPSKAVLRLGTPSNELGITIDRDRIPELIQILQSVANESEIARIRAARYVDQCTQDLVRDALEKMAERNMAADIGRMQFASGKWPL